MSINTKGIENRREPALGDLDSIDFGLHKGTPLQDVPARYLSWIWNDAGYKSYSVNMKPSTYPTSNKKTPLANYIWNSRSALNEELGESLIG